eukprot:758857-Hanusia_phi.AAC.7
MKPSSSVTDLTSRSALVGPWAPEASRMGHAVSLGTSPHACTTHVTCELRRSWGTHVQTRLSADQHTHWHQQPGCRSCVRGRT